MTTSVSTPNYEQLLKSATAAKQKYPDRVPILVNKAERCKSLPDIRKKKFLVPRDLTIGQFCFVLRRHIHITDKQALFMTVNGRIPHMNALISDLYERQRSDDEFLHISYMGENTFG